MSQPYVTTAYYWDSYFLHVDGVRTSQEKRLRASTACHEDGFTLLYFLIITFVSVISKEQALMISIQMHSLPLLWALVTAHSKLDLKGSGEKAPPSVGLF
jgi:hypothetical protein